MTMIRRKDNRLWLRMIWMLALMMGINTAAAQDNYDPANPPEPQVKYTITAVASPDEAGSVSGRGKYTEGTNVYVNTSAKTGFVFLYWLKDGVEYSQSQGFYYTMERADVCFEAVYDYAPPSPVEPSELLMRPLWLECSPSDACSFNINSGTKYPADQWVMLMAFANQNFVFQGWYDNNGQKLSENIFVNYIMPENETTLTARYVYNPTSPDEPAQGEGQTSVDNGTPGDVNSDNTVDASDCVELTNAFLNANGDKKYDVNKDSSVDAADVVKVVNIYLDE